MTFKKQMLAIAVVLFSFTTAWAQTVTTNTWQIGGGPTKVLDTYLSQEKFSGGGMTLLISNERQRQDRQWTMMVEHELSMSTVGDRADNRDELLGGYSLLVGPLRRWQCQRLRLQAGIRGVGSVGFIYNTGNTNNPAQARLSLQAMPTLTAAYPLTLWHRPLLLRYELQLPLVGLMFTPNYGQSYYEIFSLGNYDHNIVPTTFVSAPNFRNMFSAEYPVSRQITLRLSCLGNYQQASVNNLKSHVYNTHFMIGIVRRLTILNEEW